MPSSIAAYVHDIDAFDNFQKSTQDVGVVRYQYRDGSSVFGSTSGIAFGTATSQPAWEIRVQNTSHQVYVSQPGGGQFLLTRLLPQTIRSYHGTQTTNFSFQNDNPATYDETTFVYERYVGTASSTTQSNLSIRKVTQTLPAVSEATNGSNTTISRSTWFDPLGRKVFEERSKPLGATQGLDFYQYDARGLLVQMVEDVKCGAGNAAVSSSLSQYNVQCATDGFHRRHLYTYDPQSRQTVAELPSGRQSRSHYTKLGDERLVVLESDFVNGLFAGPASYSVVNHAGNAEGVASIKFETAGTTTTAMSGWISSSVSDLSAAVLVGQLSALSTSGYDKTGQRAEWRREYTTLPGVPFPSSTAAFDETSMAYDGMGRVAWIKDPTGTIDETIRDAVGRPIERRTGTARDGPGANMVAVSKIVYDNDGIGDGHVTQTTQIVDANPANNRVTTMQYDTRGRLLATVAPLAPHSKYVRDNLGRVIESSSHSGIPMTAANRVSGTTVLYDSRGQSWKTVRTAYDDSGTAVSTITELNWFDDAGNNVRHSGSDGVAKWKYDRLGRRTHDFSLAVDGDTTTKPRVFVDADKIVSETQYLYDDLTDVLAMQVQIDRHPSDETTLGALDAADTSVNTVAIGNTAFKGRASITSYYYDTRDRQLAAVALGDNGGTSYSRTGDNLIGTRSETRLISSTAYGANGFVSSSTDPKGRVAVETRDTLGRTIKSVANYIDGTAGPGDQDQVVEYTYGPGSLMASMTARTNQGSGNDQTTTYSYGVNTSGSIASKVASNRLLAQVTYPDSNGSPDVVRYAYDRTGSAITTVDQAGNAIAVDFDARGRELARRVEAVASGFDATVRRISLSYTTRGQIQSVTQYDATTNGNVLDQVTYQYDASSHLTGFLQDVDGVVGSVSAGANPNRSSFGLEYTLEKAGGAANGERFRRTGQKLYRTHNVGTAADRFHWTKFNYGTINSIDNLLSRVHDVRTDIGSEVTVASYSYMGTSTLAGTTLDQPQLETSLFEIDGVSGAVSYADMDRFGRPTRWNWSRIGSGLGGFYDTAVTFDANSNPTSTVDNVRVRQGTGKHIFDVVYTLDGLDRMVGAKEGHRTGTNNTNFAIQSGFVIRNELWNQLSLTGNWGNRQLDRNGDGDFTDFTDFNETNNSFNKANEWTARTPGPNLSPQAMTFDAVGNMTSWGSAMALGYNYKYDVFGRLVEVRDFESTAIARYRYNGLGHRIMWQHDADFNGILIDDERYYFMYDERWRSIAAFRNQDTHPKEAFVYHAAGFGGYGDASYIDSVILRDRDNDDATTTDPSNGWRAAADATLDERVFYCQNWRADVVALAKADGTPMEYIRYSSYGEPFSTPAADLNVDGVVDMADAALWQDLQGGGGGDSAYDVNLDFNESFPDQGDIDLFDESFARSVGHSAMDAGPSSAWLGNRKGYAGYEYDRTIRSYHVRHRVLVPELGLWTRRDPLGYVDGASLYHYVSSSAIRWVDPLGLQPARPLPLTQPAQPLRLVPGPAAPGNPIMVPSTTPAPVQLPSLFPFAPAPNYSPNPQWTPTPKVVPVYIPPGWIEIPTIGPPGCRQLYRNEKTGEISSTPYNSPSWNPTPRPKTKIESILSTIDEQMKRPCSDFDAIMQVLDELKTQVCDGLTNRNGRAGTPCNGGEDDTAWMMKLSACALLYEIEADTWRRCGRIKTEADRIRYQGHKDRIRIYNQWHADCVNLKNPWIQR